MEKTEIYIWGRDRSYAEALSRYITGASTGFRACLLTHEEEAKRRILDQQFVLSDAVLPGRYLFLAEKRESDKVQENPCLYKYLPADVLMDEVRYHIAGFQGGTMVSTGRAGTQRTGLIVFVAGAGGRGNSAITVTAGRCLAQEGARVLCLSLEQVSAMHLYSGAGGVIPLRSISDYLYKVLSGKKVLSENGFTCQDTCAVRYFYDEEGINPLAGLSSDEAETFLAYLTGEETYDYILADVPDITIPVAICALARCGKVLLTGDASPVSKYKNGQIGMMLSVRENGTPLRIREVVNRWDGLCAEEMGDAFLIREEPEAFCHAKENTEILPHTGFTGGVQAICRWIKEG